MFDPDLVLEETISSGLNKISAKDMKSRLAYRSGCYFGVLVVLSWEVVDRPALLSGFWTILDDHCDLSPTDIVFFIAANSIEKIYILPQMIPNPELLRGQTWKHYAAGYRECVQLVLHGLRDYFGRIYGENYTHHFQMYLLEKLDNFPC